MKFLAILRDSIREALDAKVLYFLVGLSALVIVAVASISFQAEPGEKGLQSIMNRLPGGQRGMGMPQPPLSYTAEKFEQTNDTPRAWEGEFRYDLVVTENPEQKRGGASDEDPDDEEKPRPKKKEGKERQPNVFRTIVLMTTLVETPEKDLTPQEQKIKDRLGAVGMEMMRSGGNPSRKLIKKFNEEVAQAADQVSADRLEKWLRGQFATKGAQEVTSIKLTEEDKAARTFRFQVESKARPDTVRTWPHSLVLFFGGLTVPTPVGPGEVVYVIENYLVAGLGAGLTMLLATIITAFFIPNMLRKGTVDLLIAKPIHRWYLLVCKYVGGLTFMFINTVVIVVGIWLVLGLRSGLWGTGFLLSIFVLTFQFAIFYAVSTLLGVWTRSAIVSILGTVAFWFLLWGIGLVIGILRPFHEFKVLPDWAWSTAQGIRVSLPRYKDLDALNAQLIASDLMPRDSTERKQIDREVESIRWAESVGVTVAYIAVFLGLACWWFTRKDY